MKTMNMKTIIMTIVGLLAASGTVNAQSYCIPNNVANTACGVNQFRDLNGNCKTCKVDYHEANLKSTNGATYATGYSCAWNGNACVLSSCGIIYGTYIPGSIAISCANYGVTGAATIACSLGG